MHVSKTRCKLNWNVSQKLFLFQCAPDEEVDDPYDGAAED